jgi:hypothetical protein
VIAEFFVDQTEIPGPGCFALTVAYLPAYLKCVLIILCESRVEKGADQQGVVR